MKYLINNVSRGHSEGKGDASFVSFPPLPSNEMEYIRFSIVKITTIEQILMSVLKVSMAAPRHARICLGATSALAALVII